MLRVQVSLSRAALLLRLHVRELWRPELAEARTDGRPVGSSRAHHRVAREDRLSGGHHDAARGRARDRDDPFSARRCSALCARAGLRVVSSASLGLRARSAPHAERGVLREARRRECRSPRFIINNAVDGAPSQRLLRAPAGRRADLAGRAAEPRSIAPRGLRRASSRARRPGIVRDDLRRARAPSRLCEGRRSGRACGLVSGWRFSRRMRVPRTAVSRKARSTAICSRSTCESVIDWRLALAEVSAVECSKSSSSMHIAPFILNARLKALMQRSPERASTSSTCCDGGAVISELQDRQAPHTNRPRLRST